MWICEDTVTSLFQQLPYPHVDSLESPVLLFFTQVAIRFNLRLCFTAAAAIAMAASTTAGERRCRRQCLATSELTSPHGSGGDVEAFLDNFPTGVYFSAMRQEACNEDDFSAVGGALSVRLVLGWRRAVLCQVLMLSPWPIRWLLWEPSLGRAWHEHKLKEIGRWNGKDRESVER